MVFLANLEGKDLLFTYAIFGIQHSPTITDFKKSTITTLYTLLSSSAGRIDRLQVETHGTAPTTPQTTTFVAYWLHSADYNQWTQRPDVKAFWDNLPDDAGVWREVMTVPKSRYMFAASQNVQWGLASLIDGLRQSNDEGYWGVYRHRLGDTPDQHTDPSDTFTSDYITETRAASANSERSRRVIRIPERATSLPSTIRKGRVQVFNVPNNLCFVREGQRQSNVSKDELDLWLAKISPHARSWIDHLDVQRQKNGVVSFTTHLATEAANAAASSNEGNDAVAPDALPETDQLAYFLDLAHFELAGRAHKGHVQLRKTVMEIYGPGGQMSQLGKAELFVELCVLKSENLHAEYIGCTEGTGLMWLADM